MLLNLLPGFRELRAPLAAGYLWLLFAWLLAEPHIPDAVDTTGVLHSLQRLGEAATPVGIGVAVGFAAYLIGSITERLIPAVISALFETRISVAGRSALSKVVENTTTQIANPDVAIDNFVLNRRLRRAASKPTRPSRGLRRFLDDVRESVRAGRIYSGTVARDDYEPTFIAELLDDLPLVRTRLQREDKGLFSTSDRLQSEATLRFAIFPPLIALIVVLVAEGTAWWALAVLPALVMLKQAVDREREAGDILVDALRLRLIGMPALEELKKAS